MHQMCAKCRKSFCCVFLSILGPLFRNHMPGKSKQKAPAAAHQQDEGNKPVAPAYKYSLTDIRVQSLILILIGFLFYANTFSHEAAFDDRMAITDNEYVQQGIAGIGGILTTDAFQSYLEHKNSSNQLAGGRYRPLSLITFAIEQQLMGTDHANENAAEKEQRVAEEMHMRHVVNVLLYIVSLIVLLTLFHTVIFPDEPVIALLAALIFAIHPLHTEVVANVKSRDEVLSVLFIALTILKAFAYKESGKLKDLVFGCLFFFCALLSKEYAVTLIVILPIAFYLFKNEPLPYGFKTFAPYLISLGLYILLRLNAVTGAGEGAENNVLNNPYLYAGGLQKLATEIFVLLNYLKLLLFPDVLTADYGYSQIPIVSFSNLLVWLSLAIHLLMVVLMFVYLRKQHVIGFAILFYLANLMLVSNLFINIGAPMGERLIYHSSVGFAIAAGYLLSKGFGMLNIARISKGGLAGFTIVLVAVSGFKTIERNRDWKNDTTLFLADVNKSPNSALVNNNAAAACMSLAKKDKQDVAARNEWLKKAVQYFDKALSLYPDYYLSRVNRGLCYYNLGMPDKALPDWDTVRKYAPAQENIKKYLGIAGKYFFAQGMKYKAASMADSSIYSFKKSTEAMPDSPEGYYELGRAYYAKGDYANAIIAFEKVLSLAPAYSDARTLYEQAKANARQ